MTPPSRRGLLFTLAGVVVSIALAVILRYTTSATAQVAFAIGLLGTMLTLFLRAYSLFIDRFEALERSVIDAAQLRALTTMPDVERLVVDITKYFTGLNSSQAGHAAFFRDYARSVLAEAEERVCQANTGVVSCAQDDEIYLVRDALRHTRGKVSAIAARGVSWWSKPEADAYWEAYGRAAADGLSIERVFLVDGPVDQGVQRVLDRHLALGMKTYYVQRDRIPERFRTPIVLFDDTLLHRPAGLSSPGGEHVSFTRNVKELALAEAHFDYVIRMPETQRWSTS